MNKQQREYAIDRIKRIAGEKEFVCECEKPSLLKHIRRAIASGASKLKPSKDITALIESNIMDNSYDRNTVNIIEIFEAPQSYKEALSENAAEQKRHDDANKEVRRFSQGLIDRVELGEFEDGKEPIRLMQAYAPKQPKKVN